MLRTRLTLILSLAFVALVLALVVAGREREHLLEQRFATVVISGQLSLWDQLITAEVEELGGVAEQVTGDAILLDALARNDLAALRALGGSRLDAMVDTGQIDAFEIVGRDGLPLLSSAAEVGGGSLLGRAMSERLVVQGATLAGLTQDRPNRYIVTLGVPLRWDGATIGAAVLAVEASRLLDRFAAALGTATYLVSLRGRTVQGTDPALAGALPPSIPVREPSFSVSETDGRLFSATGVPVRDIEGNIAGTLVSLRDVTATMSEARFLGRLAILGVIVFVLVVLGGLYAYLRRSFRPLEDAITVLRALAQGDTSVMLAADGRGEIGRIAEAVELFRRNMIALAEQRRQVDRQRRRQERLIRRQMEQLAATLESEGRRAVLEDLQAIVAGRPANGRAPAGESEDAQLGLLAAVLQRMSARIAEQHGRLTELIAELREAIVTRAKLAGLQQELEIAREVQRAILPHAFPPRPELEIDGCMVPAKEIGGDFYDFFPLQDERIGVVVADVSGKGVPAALFMAITRTLLKATALFTPSPAACVERVNRLLAAENEQLMFVTLIYGIIEPATGRFTFTNAGHNRPFLIHRDGTLEKLEAAGGVVLAVHDAARYVESTVALAPGDTLFLYTDGVTEAFDIDDAEFGESGLVRLLGSGVAELPVAGVGAEVIEAVRVFGRGAPQTDDITCVTIRWHGPAGATPVAAPAVRPAA